MSNKLHQRRVKALRKLKGKYFSIRIRGRRHAEQVRYALKDAGFSFDEDSSYTTYCKYFTHWIVYHQNNGYAGLYTFEGAGDVLHMKHFI